MGLWLSDGDRARLGRALGMPVGRRLGYGSFGAVFATSEPWIVKVTEDGQEARTWGEWKGLGRELYPAVPAVLRVHRLRWAETVKDETWVRTTEDPRWVIVREEGKSSLEQTDRQDAQLERYEKRLLYIRRYGFDAHAVGDIIATPYREEIERLLRDAELNRDHEVFLLAATLLRFASEGKILPDLQPRNLAFRKWPELGPPCLLIIDPSVGPGREKISDELIANPHAD